VRVLCLSFVILFALVSGASADWEYTRWGMTPEQVAAASKGMVKVLPANARNTQGLANLQEAAAGTHKDGNLLLDVRFSFNTGTNGLDCVTYALRNAAQNALLKDTLTKRYGPPQKQGGIPDIGLEETSWTKADDIDFATVKGRGAVVLHCRK